MSIPLKLMTLDPYDGKTGLLVPFVLERVRRGYRERAGEIDADQAVALLGARVYGRDPSISILAFIDDGIGVNIVGHAIASMESDGVNTWCFISQVVMDPGDWGDVVIRAMKEADKWAKWYSEEVLQPRGMKPIKHMLMATNREDKAWQRKFGFRSHRHVMMRDVGSDPAQPRPEPPDDV